MSEDFNGKHVLTIFALINEMFRVNGIEKTIQDIRTAANTRIAKLSDTFKPAVSQESWSILLNRVITTAHYLNEMDKEKGGGFNERN